METVLLVIIAFLLLLIWFAIRGVNRNLYHLAEQQYILHGKNHPNAKPELKW